MLTLNDVFAYDDIHIPGEINIGDADLVYVRNFSANPSFAGKRTEDVKDKTLNEIRLLSLQFSLAKIMADRIPVINDLWSSMFHRLKAYQYYLLHSNGISVPKTLVTNNLYKIRKFIHDLDHRVIAKPNTSAAEVLMADTGFFEQNQHILESRPFIFQQYVNGRSFRAYLLGGKIISMGEIHYDRRFVDWRERTKSIVTYDPEESLKRQIEKAVRTLGLAYCSVDIEYDDYTRKHYLLDFNPSGLFTGWGRLVKMNIAGSIAEYLIEVLKRDGNIWQD
jgi:glutathione synthase/RimK-type ligase-like ATP-grasp enzyme